MSLASFMDVLQFAGKGCENSMSMKQGSMRESINKIYTALIEDEELLRLLYYPPTKRISPLDKTVNQPDLIGHADYWDIVDDRIMTATKSSDIEDKKICRLYIYAGRRRPKFRDYMLVDQEVVIDILVNETYDSDLRLNWICDRINEIIALEHITGYGKLTYIAGNPRQAPIGYSKYETMYEFRANTK